MINKIGLEAEFLLRNQDGDILLPSKHGLPHDDLIVIGEIRGQEGTNRHETIANFYNEFYRIAGLIKNAGLIMDIEQGWASLNPAFYAEIMREAGTKSVAKCRNIYDTDILEYSDAITKGGKILAQNISTGLHVHFSSFNQERRKIKQVEYTSVTLPLKTAGVGSSLDLFAKGEEKETVIEATATRITKPVVRYIVESMDKTIYPKFKLEQKLKYRLPGFYEDKANGHFEYRSLPFNRAVLQSIDEVVDTAYSLLENL